MLVVGTLEVVISVLAGSSILITGGTGSFGKAFTAEMLANHDPSRIVIFSRDELKQYEVRQKFRDDPRLRFFIGDIRDRHRLTRAMHGVDYVVIGPLERSPEFGADDAWWEANANPVFRSGDWIVYAVPA